MTRVLLWVQHLLGTGHVERARWLAEALVARGAAVTFVTGGMPLPGRMPEGADIVQLEPLRSVDATFARLVDASGAPVDAAMLARRADQLAAAFDRAHPQAVVLETWPFGRRALHSEIERLLARVADTVPRPRVVTSVRDLLHVRGDAARDAAAWALARSSVDAILVHGERAFARFEETFAPAADGAIPVVYTGYVRDPRPATAQRERDAIVVAGSGGDAGEALLRCAIAARAHSAHGGLRWHVLVGRGVHEERFADLRAAGEAAGLDVERHRDDFADLLAGARVAVTQAGYNTVLDVLVARAPCVLVPFEDCGETEQAMRAQRLAAMGRAIVVRERELAPERLAAAIDRAAAQPLPPPCPFRTEGAQRAAEALLALVRTGSAA